VGGNPNPTKVSKVVRLEASVGGVAEPALRAITSLPRDPWPTSSASAWGELLLHLK
jgi:hypothetical protein